MRAVVQDNENDFPFLIRVRFASEYFGSSIHRIETVTFGHEGYFDPVFKPVERYTAIRQTVAASGYFPEDQWGQIARSIPAGWSYSRVKDFYQFDWPNLDFDIYRTVWDLPAIVEKPERTVFLHPSDHRALTDWELQNANSKLMLNFDWGSNSTTIQKERIREISICFLRLRPLWPTRSELENYQVKLWK